MLTTHAECGVGLASRPLQTMRIERDSTLWFFTARDSAKVVEIGRDPRVCACYADAPRRVFAVLSGEATIVVDQERAASMWRPSQRVFFPGGPEDSTLVLIRMMVETATVWDGNEPLLGMIRKFGRALLRGEASDLGTVRAMALGDCAAPSDGARDPVV